MSDKAVSLADVELVVDGELAMLELGKQLAVAILPATTVYLEGDLGAGKTTLCRGLLRGFGHDAAVKSPTYTLVEPYQLQDQSIYHFDLYRLADPSELEYVGIRDYFEGGAICIIEWPERGLGFLPPADLVVTIEVKGSGRLLTLTAATVTGGRVVEHLIGMKD